MNGVLIGIESDFGCGGFILGVKVGVVDDWV